MTINLDDIPTWLACGCHGDQADHTCTPGDERESDQ